MKHLKIKAKLLLGFALVSLMTTIVGLVGTIGLTSTNTRYEETLKLSTTGITAMAEMRELYQKERLMLRSILIDVNNVTKTQSYIDNLNTYEVEMSEAMNLYESTIVDPSSEESYFLAKETYQNEYAALKDNYIEAARQGDADKATSIFAEGTVAIAPITTGFEESMNYMTGLLGKEMSEMSKTSTRTIAIQVVTIVFAVAFAIGFGHHTATMLSNPISTLSGFLTRFGTQGDLSLTENDHKNIAANADSRDEIGQCINSAAKMYERIIHINETLESVADGDLSVEFEVLSEKDSIGHAVSKMVASLNKILGELHMASEQVSIGSEQIAHGAQELAAGSSEQSSSLEEFSVSLAELQEKTQNTANNSMNAHELANQSGSKIIESIDSMGDVLKKMKEIDESSKNITKVIKVIEDIAFQTNILALNAAVEAARAGQHGKGFAVVAGEVRNLAGKSAEAAKETADLIKGSTEKVKEGNVLVNKTNASLEAVVTGAKEASELLEVVTSASIEQARTIEEMNRSIEQISTVVQSNSSAAEESAAAAEELSSQAEMLNSIAASFKLSGVKAGTKKVAELPLLQEKTTLTAAPTNHNEKYF